MPSPHFTARLSLLALALALAGCAGDGASRSSRPAAANGAAPRGFAQGDPLRIVEADIATLAARMADGNLSSVRLTQAYLDRIAALDDNGPRLNAVIEINPNAIAEARALDEERKAGKLRGPLHGIPVLVKDNIDTTPMVNSAGSLALAEHRPKRDAPLVAALRAAGAVILGKTNLSEWANFRSDRSISGWSARGGLTRNPYVLDRSACGSSSGTGTAIAANLAAVGVGTETDGSVLCPSAMSGLVGFKPTVGLVSRAGIIPISSSQDTAGPMARSVADAAQLLSVLAAAEAGDDAAARAAAGKRLADYVAALDADSLNGARLGLLRDSAVKLPPEGNAALQRALKLMRDAGATIVEVRMPNDGKWREAELQVLLYEFKDGLERYLRDSGAPIKTMDELIAFNRANAAHEMPYFGQELLEQAARKNSLKDPAYRKAAAQARQLAGAQGIDAALRQHKLDALIAPTTSPAFMVDPVNGDVLSGDNWGAAAVAGYPSLTVPMGEASGLPIGLAFIGKRWSDAQLLSLGYAFEQAAQARTPPRYRATLSP
ncbi:MULTISPECIES: amidase [unclassified Lysobacter]|uniref:amidase n=1 Tax=unclassified Lysobacter TaxID=2635362 RepID=UPI001BEC935B|nr:MULTISPECIES: amidase [unclassified Lysobacter]MBT2747632.1 amidase [Lysobacter sp. ISL-42]MBT2752291.1 amidase [Lysobacter sp. ISL-50]MBT2777450.1 amidase [Lysobacter sp. ISL-54]MBT2784404.1 amidase [Lysobacter sp. ISL-52]